jgi:hypothetical protein
MLSPRNAQRIARGDLPHMPRAPKFLFEQELLRRPCGRLDMIVIWNDGILGYTYDPQHPIAERIGPDMALFIAGLSSDPDYCRNHTRYRMKEIVLSMLLCLVIGPFACIVAKYFTIKSDARAAIGKSKFYDSIYDFGSVHGLRVEISRECSYICFTDGSEGVQQQMRMMGSPQMMPPPGQERYQQQAQYAPSPNDMVPMMSQGYVQAPQGYDPAPQNGMQGAPPFEAYDPLDCK